MTIFSSIAFNFNMSIKCNSCLIVGLELKKHGNTGKNTYTDSNVV